jgi:glycosyltransferase involved in cell wall biosynthesis
MKISIAVTSYNRPNTIKSFEKVLNDHRVDDIVIVDDHSDPALYRLLKQNVLSANASKKIRLFRNEKNLDCYKNKRRAVSLVDNEWCILLDSDNSIDEDYIDAIDQAASFKMIPPNIILQPEYARPHFDFRRLTGTVLDKGNIAEFIGSGDTQTMLNAMNFFVNKDWYLKVFDDLIDPVTSDSLYFNYCWLREGGKIQVTPGMQYDHPISEDSHYKKNVKRTPKFLHDELLKKLRDLQ